MKMADFASTGSDAKIPDDMAPWLDLNVDWIQIRNTPAKKVHSMKEDLKRQRGSRLCAQRQIEHVDLLDLNGEKRFAANIKHQNMGSQKVMIIVGVPGTRKSTVVKAVTNILNETVENSTSVVHVGMAGTVDIVISGATYRSVLGIPVNSPFKKLNGAKRQHLRERLDGIKLIIIDEITMMGK